MTPHYYELAVEVEDNSLLYLALQDFDDIGIEEENQVIKIYSEEDLSEIDSALEELYLRANSPYLGVLAKKKNKDWVDEYKKNIKPISIANVYIYPPWCEPTSDAGYINICLEPSLAFGTGHHFTTSSMIANILSYVKKNDKVLDVGTGSGILAIVAEKLGAEVDCVEVDSLALEQAQQNFTTNQCNINKCALGSINNIADTYDVVLANITADIIIALSKNMKKLLKPSALLLLSGIVSKYEEKILNSFLDFDIILNQVSEDKQWVTLVVQTNNKRKILKQNNETRK